MDFKTQTAPKKIEITQLAVKRQPLKLLRDTEALLRRPTVAILVPILPQRMGNQLLGASSIADDSLKELASVNLEKIGDLEMRSPRIQIGLSFVGFGALMIVVLLLYLNTIHPELSTVELWRKYWHQYVWFVSLGVAGMFILGREAMRS
ncbi:MAG: hypothetical protein PUP93_20030 [Rhizonema sp. NSF051]|nr:hypothetical protein [Rhizonema sp. NSF051]